MGCAIVIAPAAEWDPPQHSARQSEQIEVPQSAHSAMAGLSHGVPSALPLDAFTSIGMSYVLRVYFRHFGNFNKTRTLGAAIALMVWLYWTGFVMLVGAELNAKLAKMSREGKLQPKRKPPAITKIDPAA